MLIHELKTWGSMKHLCISPQSGQFCKESICSSGSKFFPERVDPFLEESSFESIQEVRKVVSLCEMMENMSAVMHLKLGLSTVFQPHEEYVD